jgi:hypothetical protein
MAKHCPIHEFSRIEQMLRLEMLRRPTAALFQLNTQKIADVTEPAVANNSIELPVAVADRDWCAWINRSLHLKAYARKRYVFQICYPPPSPAGLVFPKQFNEVGAKQPIISSPFLHMSLIGFVTGKVKLFDALKVTIRFSTFSTVWVKSTSEPLHRAR